MSDNSSTSDTTPTDSTSDQSGSESETDDLLSDNPLDGIVDSDPDDQTGEKDIDLSSSPDGVPTGAEDSQDSEGTLNAGGEGATTDQSGAPTLSDEPVEATSPFTAQSADKVEIGHVIASDEMEIGREEHNLSIFVAPNRREGVGSDTNLTVGDYVQIPYPDGDTQLFAAVHALRYQPYTDLDDMTEMYGETTAASDLNESEYAVVADLDPIGILDTTGKQATRHIVNRIPKPATTAHLSRDGELLRTGLNIPQDGLFTGYLSIGGEPMTIEGQKFPYYLPNPGIDPDTGVAQDGEPALFRHTLIAGSTGSGKTHFTKNLLRQIAATKQYPVDVNIGEGPDQAEPGIVIIDPENEYGELRDDNPNLTIQDELRRQGIAFGGINDLEIFVPQVRYTRAPDTGVSRELSIPFSVVQDEPQLLMPFDSMTDVTRGALVSCLNAYFDTFDDSSDWPARPVAAPTYDDFITFLESNEQDGSQLRRTNNIGDGTWDAIMRRVKQAEFNAVFDAGATPFTEQTDAMFRPGRVTVIPTSHLQRKKEELVVLSLLSFIIENKLTDYQVNADVKGTPLVVAVDEAHSFLSEPSNIRETHIVDKARQAVKQGRKELLGLMAITQDPDDIDDEILKQVNTDIFLQLREEVLRDVPSVPREFSDEIPKFSQGQAVVKAPDVEVVEVTGLPECVTRHDN